MSFQQLPGYVLNITCHSVCMYQIIFRCHVVAVSCYILVFLDIMSLLFAILDVTSSLCHVTHVVSEISHHHCVILWPRCQSCHIVTVCHVVSSNPRSRSLCVIVS